MRKRILEEAHKNLVQDFWHLSRWRNWLIEYDPEFIGYTISGSADLVDKHPELYQAFCAAERILYARDNGTQE